MTDRELLELAAKAAGIKDGHWLGDGTYWAGAYNGGVEWNPLTDDGDALAVKLRIDINNMTDACYCEGPYGQDAFVEIENDDPYAATRRAIVRAAAEIGKAVP